MACSTIQIAPANNSLSKCTPNLMPFHINYSGSAPISTYFRVKHATSRVESSGNAAQPHAEIDPETKKADIDTAMSERVDGTDANVIISAGSSTDNTTPQPKTR